MNQFLLLESLDNEDEEDSLQQNASEGKAA